jgi:hypothetical protein
MSKTYLGDGSDDGTVLGRSATDKIAFYDADPVVQAAAITDVTVSGTYADDDDAIETAINSILTVLRDAGLIAS